MPLSVFDAHDGGFQKLVVPEAQKQGLALLAMKTMAGNARAVQYQRVTAEECLRYALSMADGKRPGLSAREAARDTVAAGSKPRHTAPVSKTFAVEYPDALPDTLQMSRTEFEREARLVMAVKLFETGKLSSSQGPIWPA